MVPYITACRLHSLHFIRIGLPYIYVCAGVWVCSECVKREYSLCQSCSVKKGLKDFFWTKSLCFLPPPSSKTYSLRCNNHGEVIFPRCPSQEIVTGWFDHVFTQIAPSTLLTILMKFSQPTLQKLHLRNLHRKKKLLLHNVKRTIFSFFFSVSLYFYLSLFFFSLFASVLILLFIRIKLRCVCISKCDSVLSFATHFVKPCKLHKCIGDQH